MIEKKCILC